MFIRDDFPELYKTGTGFYGGWITVEWLVTYLGTDLVATLTSLNMNNFSHCDRLWMKMAAGEVHLKSSRGVKECLLSDRI